MRNEWGGLFTRFGHGCKGFGYKIDRQIRIVQGRPANLRPAFDLSGNGPVLVGCIELGLIVESLVDTNGCRAGNGISPEFSLTTMVAWRFRPDQSL